MAGFVLEEVAWEALFGCLRQHVLIPLPMDSVVTLTKRMACGSNRERLGAPLTSWSPWGLIGETLPKSPDIFR